MATKVFLRFNRDVRDIYVKGREYEVLQWTDGLIRTKTEKGIEFFDFEINKQYFDVVEHADSEQKEPTIAFSQAQDGTNWDAEDFGVVPDDESERNDLIAAVDYDPAWFPAENGIIKEGYFNRFGAPNDFHADTSKLRDGTKAILYIESQHKDARVFINGYYSERYTNMRRAAMDDGHLTPGQKAYIQAKEDAQAAKQQLKHDAEAKALQERAEQLSDAGKAMDRVNQDHGHRLGWMA